MDEQLQYPVHGSQVRYAVAAMRQQGIPFGVQPAGNGIYIIVIPAAYGPAVQGAPWAYQSPPAMSALQQIPFVQVAIAVLILVGAWFAFQAAPMVLAGLAGEAAVVEEEKGSEGEGESGNPLAAALDAVLAIPDTVTAEVDRRVDEAKQEVEAAVFGAAMTFCGVPLLVGLVVLALLFVLRMVVRRR
jgi:hypothetical protein